MEKSHLGPEQPNSAQSAARVPALPLSAGPHLSASFPSPALALTPAPSLLPVGSTCRRQFPSRAHPILSLRSGSRPSALTTRSCTRSCWSVDPACRTHPSRTAHPHDLHVVVDSAEVTLAPSFSSCPTPHSLSPLIRTPTAPQHPPRTRGAPPPSTVVRDCSTAVVESPSCRLPL